MTIVSCPVEDGKIVSNLGGFVRGAGSPKGAKIVSKKNGKVYSISKGKVKYIGYRSKVLCITNKDMTYKYIGVNTELKKGQEVEVGSLIGNLDRNFIFLRIMKKGKEVIAEEYLNCKIDKL